MNITLNIVAMVILLYMSYLNYRNYSKSIKACGEVLRTIRVSGKFLIAAGLVMVLLYPVMVFSRGVVFNAETILSMAVLVVVLFSFVVTYQTSALFFTTNGIIMKGVLFEYNRVRQYKLADNGKKASLYLTVKDIRDKEVNYYYKMTLDDKASIENIMKTYFKKGKKK